MSSPNSLIRYSKRFLSTAQTSTIRIRTHTDSFYGVNHKPQQSGFRKNRAGTIQNAIPRELRCDFMNIKYDNDLINYEIPPEIDKDTILSWINQIIKSASLNDIRGIKLIYQQILSFKLSIIYQPLYHSLIFGFGRLGDIDNMLLLYNQLITNNNNNNNTIKSDIITTILTSLSTRGYYFDAINIFDSYLNNSNNSPDINNFCSIFKICAFIRNKNNINSWNLLQKYFNIMYNDYNIYPNSLCFKYILNTASYCHPPKYEESLLILTNMKHDWNIEPNIDHFIAILRTLSTPYKYYQKSIEIHSEYSNEDYNKYKSSLLHNKLIGCDRNKLNESDLQICLNLFHSMIDKYNILPNDAIFSRIFYACDRANNLEMALKYRLYWKNNYPHIRQQAGSFLSLITICSNLSSWNDAIHIYKSTSLIDKLNETNYDTDSMSLEAYHKIAPNASIFEQLLRCNKNDISRQIYDNNLNIIDAEILLLNRIQYIQSEMYNHRYNPTDRIWMFLFQSAAIIQSSHLCNRFIKRLFQYSLKPYGIEYMNHINDNCDVDVDVDVDDEESFDNCWDYYDINKINLPQTVIQSILEALYWSNQMNQSLLFYHDVYYIKKLFTHWHIAECNKNNINNININIDLHNYTVAGSAIALLYIFHNEFENVYNALLYQDLNDLNDKIQSKIEIDIELNINDRKFKKNVDNKNINIITGKGTGNAEGISILRPWIKNCLLNEFDPPIKSHIHPKNIGELVLDCNDVLTYISENRDRYKINQF